VDDEKAMDSFMKELNTLRVALEEKEAEILNLENEKKNDYFNHS